MRWGELAISAGMALLAAAFFALGNFTQTINPIDPGPAAYPRMVSLLLFVASATQLYRAWRRTDGAPGGGGPARGDPRAGYRYSLGTLALSLLYVALFDKASYLVTTTGFLVALMCLGGVRSRIMLVGVAGAYALATYYLFGKLLMVPLP